MGVIRIPMGRNDVVWWGRVRRGGAWRGWVRLGEVRLGLVVPEEVSGNVDYVAWPGSAWRGEAWQGWVR